MNFQVEFKLNVGAADMDHLMEIKDVLKRMMQQGISMPPEILQNLLGLL